MSAFSAQRDSAHLTPPGRHTTRLGHALLVLGLLIALLPARPSGSVAQTSDHPPVAMVPGTVDVSQSVSEALRTTLEQATTVVNGSTSFAVTSVRDEGTWLLVSVVGMESVDAEGSWSLEASSWFGLVLLHADAGGDWIGAVEGTTAFTELLALVPDTILNPDAKTALDPLTNGFATAATVSYRFPWQPGTKMIYGTRGVHAADYAGIFQASGWKAVDLLSDGNQSVGNAPNRVLAMAGGTIGPVCEDAYSLAFRMGDLIYAHFKLGQNLVTGRTFSQGAEIGQLRPGSFQANCGWAEQGSNFFHLHLGFPATSAFTVEDWTLNLADGIWRRGSTSVGAGGALTAGLSSAVSTILSFEVGLYDLTTPYPGYSAYGPFDPVQRERDLSVLIRNGGGDTVINATIRVTFNPFFNAYRGQLDIGTQLAPGSYIATVKLSNTLRRAQTGFFTVGNGGTISIPKINLIVGDVTNNNVIDINDYNQLMDCYSDLRPPRNCNATKQAAADLNGDGKVQQYDYNTMLRAILNQLGG